MVVHDIPKSSTLFSVLRCGGRRARSVQVVHRDGLLEVSSRRIVHHARQVRSSFAIIRLRGEEREFAQDAEHASVRCSYLYSST